MSAPWLMVVASLLFALMGACVKLAAARYGAGEIVLYRGLTGAVVIALYARTRGGSLRTAVPLQHAGRSLTGVVALCMWFYAMGKLPLATAMTLNYTSSVWMALFMLGAAALLGRDRVDPRLLLAAALGFAGVALILRPTIEQNQVWAGMVGLLSGMISAAAYLQVTALGRAGEPDYRIVFYFSLGSMAAGVVLGVGVGWHAHSLSGLALLIAVGLLGTVAQLMMTRAYSIGRPLVNASLQYLGIAYSFMLGVLLFDDHVTWLAVVGMMLIVAAGIGATRLRSRVAAAAVAPQEVSP
jgi:S-adenosylmethionine uptake transporter